MTDRNNISQRITKLTSFALLAVVAGAIVGWVGLGIEPILRTPVPSLNVLGAVAYISIHVLLAAAWLTPVAIAAAAPDFSRFDWAIAPAASGVGFGVFAYFVGLDAISGPWASTQWWAGAAPAGFGVAGFSTTFVLVAIGHRYPSWFISLPAAGLSVAALAADVILFPGTYAMLHLGLRVAGIGLGVLAFGCVAAKFRRDPPLWLALTGLLMVCAASVGWFAQTATASKSMLLRQGPAANLVELVAPERIAASDALVIIETPSIDESSPLPPAPLPDRVVDNVVLFYVDTLRFDAIPPGRPEGGTRFARAEDTPFLNKFLRSCHRFERAFAPSSATHKSIPSTFLSRESWQSDGYPLGFVLDENDVQPAAVTLNYFDHTKHDASTRLLIGFENVTIFDSHRQSDAIPATKAMLDELQHQRFFAWIHFFAVHRPGWDGKLLSRSIDHPKRYRRSLAWLDETLATIVAELEELGLIENTAIVLASDHGEGIGDHNVETHGPTLFDTEIRVPMAICLPDGKGEVHAGTVGNIDLIPTLLDLMGISPDSTHLGHSLGRQLLKGEVRAERSYYFENWSGDRSGVWFRDKKLMFAPRQKLHFMYDHATDPDETGDVFDEELHAAYARLLREHNADYINPEIRRDRRSDALLDVLSEVNAAQPPARIEFLLRIAPSIANEEIEAEVRRLFHETPHFWLKARVFDAFRDHPLSAQLLAESHSRSEASPEIIRAAARHKVSLARFPQIEPFVLARAQDTEGDTFTAWLELANHAFKDGEAWREWLLAELREIARGKKIVSDVRRRILVTNVATTDWAGSDEAAKLLAASFLDDDDTNVQWAASRALGTLGYRSAVPALLDAAADPVRGHMVRREALRSLGKLADRSSGPAIARAVQGDLFLSKHGAFALAKIGDESSAKKLIKRHPRIADDARKALKDAAQSND